MYNYGELELRILSCFWLKPELLETTKLENKHFKNNEKIFVLFKSFYEKFDNLNIETVCSLVNDRYKFMSYMKIFKDGILLYEIISQLEPTGSQYDKYESLLLELYNESEREKWLREKTFELANELYLKNITCEQFKEQFGALYIKSKEIYKNDWLRYKKYGNIKM